jgi:hypothetical protein
MYCIARPINGINLNGNEYILDELGHLKIFKSRREAIQYLLSHGIPENDIESFDFPKVNDLDEKDY